MYAESNHTPWQWNYEEDGVTWKCVLGLSQSVKDATGNLYRHYLTWLMCREDILHL